MTRIISFFAVLVLCLTVFPSALYAAENVSAAEIDINSNNFPDENFRRFILNRGYDRNGDQKLSLSELSDVTEMDCGDPGNDGLRIRDLTGIEHFKALTSLVCSSNLLQELDVSGLPKLVYLDCSYNMIDSLDVRFNAALETLICNNNSMSSLKVSGCYSLISLKCEENGLTTLDISNCGLLDSLSCQSNGLTILDVTNTPLIRNYILTTPRVDEGSHIAYGEYTEVGAGNDTGHAMTRYHVEMDPETSPYSNDTGRSLDIGMNADPFLVTTLIFAYMLTRYFGGGKKSEWFED